MFALFSPRIDSHLLSFQWEQWVVIPRWEDGLSLNNGTRLIIILFFVIFEFHMQFKKGFDIKMCAYFCAIAVRV